MEKRYLPVSSCNTEYRFFSAKHASTLLTQFLKWWFQTPPSNASNNRLGFLDHLAIFFRSSGHTVHISTTETTRNHVEWGPRCMTDASSYYCCGVQATLAQEQLYVGEHCLGESTVEAVMIVPSGYNWEVYLVPSYNTPYLSAFLEGRRVDRPFFGNRRRQPTSLCLLTCWRTFFVLNLP